MNLGEYRVAVKNRLGIPTADTNTPNSRFDDAINAALKHIATQADWPWLFTEDSVSVAANQNIIFVSPNVTDTVYLMRDNYELNLRQLRDIARLVGITGAPTMWAPKGETLVVAPTPAEALTLRHGYIRREPLLIVDTDAPLMPDAYSDWLVNEAAVRIGIATNNADRVAHLREEALVAKKAVIDNVRRSAGLPRIRRMKPPVWPENY